MLLLSLLWWWRTKPSENARSVQRSLLQPFHVVHDPLPSLLTCAIIAIVSVRFLWLWYLNEEDHSIHVTWYSINQWTPWQTLDHEIVGTNLPSEMFRLPSGGIASPPASWVVFFSWETHRRSPPGPRHNHTRHTECGHQWSASGQPVVSAVFAYTHTSGQREKGLWFAPGMCNRRGSARGWLRHQSWATTAEWRVSQMDTLIDRGHCGMYVFSQADFVFLWTDFDEDINL